MGDNFNTIAGWALAAGIAALGLTIVTGEMFKPHGVEKGGYPIEGAAVEGGAEAEKPIAALMQTADAGKGKEVFAKCSSCHTIAVGGANGQGPNLNAIMGKGIASIGGFAYSDSLKGKGGKWDFDSMSAWLRNPKRFAEGTKMSFAGISNGEDRANLIAYLNSEGSNLPLPAAPKEDAAPAAAGKDGAAAPANATAPAR